MIFQIFRQTLSLLTYVVSLIQCNYVSLTIVYFLTSRIVFFPSLLDTQSLQLTILFQNCQKRPIPISRTQMLAYFKIFSTTCIFLPHIFLQRISLIFINLYLTYAGKCSFKTEYVLKV